MQGLGVCASGLLPRHEGEYVVMGGGQKEVQAVGGLPACAELIGNVWTSGPAGLQKHLNKRLRTCCTARGFGGFSCQGRHG